MCEQCSAEVDEFGHPLPGWMLCQATKNGGGQSFNMKKGQWGLVESNDPSFIWDIKPRIDPTEGFTDAELDKKGKEFWDESNKWIDEATAFGKALVGGPEEGWTLYEAALKAGYTKDKGAVCFWLFDFLGRWLEANPTPTHRNRWKTLEIGDREEPDA